MYQLDHGLWRSKGEIVGVDDKRQITAVLAGSLDLTGDFLAPQLIYKGTTKRCLPTVQFPPKWHITHSHNHWANEKNNEILPSEDPHTIH